MNIYTEDKPYCVYLTIYRGNKLPPFYIGSTSVQKIHEGYRGTVDSDEYRNTWKRELKDNPDLFKTVIVSFAITRELAYAREGKLHDQLNVVRSPLYTNRCSASFRFDNTGKRMSNEQKRKISATSTGHKKSEETKKRMRKPKSEEHNKKNSESRSKVDTILCPYCGTIGDPGVMSRWHFDNCLLNPVANPRPAKKTGVCPHCNKEVDTANLKRHHGDNCKQKTKEKGAMLPFLY